MTDRATSVTAANLLARGYKEHPPSPIDQCRRLFQMPFDDDRGRRYFLTFQEWDRPYSSEPAYDASVCTDASDGGYAWLRFKMPTIEASEQMAEALWQAAGGVYYEARNDD